VYAAEVTLHAAVEVERAPPQVVSQTPRRHALNAVADWAAPSWAH